MSKCLSCGRFVARVEGVTCSTSKCAGTYHRSCVALGTASSVPRDWSCPECRRRSLPRHKEPQTPTENEASARATPESLAEALSIADLVGELRLFKQELCAKMTDLEKRLERMESSLTFVNEKICDLSTRVDAVEAKIAGNALCADTRALENAVESLQKELNDKEQDLLLGDVQITNVPEQQGESVEHLVGLIGAKLGVTVDERDIVFAERAGPRRAAGERPRPIAVRLCRRATRTELLRAARVRRTATTADMGLAGEPQRFYVNERLTRLNRQLFRDARARAQHAGWKFVWTRDGRVYARRAEQQPAHRIRSESDLNDIFNNI